jgi:hypothetical protein
MSGADFRATCPEGHVISSIVQLIVAHAEIENFNRNKLPIYTGNTEVIYDTQESFAETGSGVMLGIADNHGDARYRCAGDCGEITYEQLVFESPA